jgi:hypothetical protein
MAYDLSGKQRSRRPVKNPGLWHLPAALMSSAFGRRQAINVYLTLILFIFKQPTNTCCHEENNDRLPADDLLPGLRPAG